jgi:hypothetical protein
MLFYLPTVPLSFHIGVFATLLAYVEEGGNPAVLIDNARAGMITPANGTITGYLIDKTN